MSPLKETIAHRTSSLDAQPEKAEVLPASQNGLSSRPLLTALICGIVVIAAFAYMHHYMVRGWVSHDEGTLAQTAERVLHGELPHRDFDDVYTGGLAYLNALALRLFGPTLASFRYMLMIFALAWTAAMYYCASRFLPPFAAGLTTLLAVAWGPANYFAALPSWYNLFFATFGTAALLRYTEVKHWRWLLLAGICGGVSVLFKISGLYFVIAAGLWLIAGSPDSGIPSSDQRKLSPRLQLFLAAIGTGVYEMFLLRLAMTKWKLPYILCFFAPAALAGMCLLLARVRDVQAQTEPEYSTSIKTTAIFLAGAAVPIVTFLTPYVRGAALRALIYGVFIEPTKRLDFAAVLPPHMGLVWGSMGAVILLISALYVEWSGMKLSGSIAVIVFTCFVLRSLYSFATYERLWTAIFVSLPLLIVLGSLVAAFSTLPTAVPQYRSKLLLVVLVAAMSALIQFPYSSPIYFCYVAALGVLLAAALVGPLPPFAKFSTSLVAAALLAFVVWQVGPVFIHNLGWRNVKYQANYVLQTPRAGGIRVPADEGRTYDRLVEVVRDHARGDYIFAGPDSPELYFLAGHRNPTATFYDFLARDRNQASILQLLSADNINLIVVNSRPEFSPPMQADLLATLNNEFPKHETIGHFDVRWRE